MAETRKEYRLWDFTQGIKLSGSSGITQSDRGTVTQLTNTTTGVTVNALAGTVTTIAGTLAAGAIESFTVTNSRVAATDIPHVAVKAYGGGGKPTVHVTAVAAGSFQITVRNDHASAALDAAISINFDVAKSA